MKNIEKYTNTKDALEAWRQSVEGGVCLSFDEWAKREYEAPRVTTLLEAAKAVTDSWLNGGTIADANEKILALADTIKREKEKPVRNFEKYKTNDEAFVAYTKMCDSRECKIFHFRYCGNSIKCVLAWLYAEAEKEEAEAEKEESDE